MEVESSSKTSETYNFEKYSYQTLNNEIKKLINFTKSLIIDNKDNKNINSRKYHQNFRRNKPVKSKTLNLPKNRLLFLKSGTMPPIEKRSPPLTKENAKENISAAPKTVQEKLTNRGPEILDFRESWIQQTDLLKSQQLLTEHNHLHTSEGCQKSELQQQQNNVNGIANGTRSSEPVKRRLRPRSVSDAQKEQNCKDQDDNLVLKRAREEESHNMCNLSMLAENRNSPIKNHHYSHPNVPLEPTQYPQIKHLNGDNTSSLTTCPRIIVNPYHASLLKAEKKTKQYSLPNSPTDTEIGQHAIMFSQNSVVVQNNAFPKSMNHKSPAKSAKEQLNDVGKELILPDAQTIEGNDNDQKIIDDADQQGTTSSSDKDGYKTDSECSTLEEDDDYRALLDDPLDSSDSEDEYHGHAYLIDSDEEVDWIETKFRCDEPIEQLDTKYYTPKTPFSPSLFPNVPPYLNFSSHVEKGPNLHPDVQKILKWRLTTVMPRIVRRVLLNSGCRLIKKVNDWCGTWDKHNKSPFFKTIRSHQKFNHIPGTFRIGRKDSVWRSIRANIGKFGRKEFGFMQKTYILPTELEQLKKSWPKLSQQNTKWIIKPPASARGSGIKVVNRWSQIPKTRPLIVQKYIERPLLINGSKFDLRLYVIITSINPLRIFMHTDGLARFASVQYSSKLETLNDRCMHLTNYSINKLSENYAKNEDVNACQGHKWTLKSLWSYFENRGINSRKIWGSIRNLVIRTVISGEGPINKVFKANVLSKYSCFELFGFDVLLDECLTPWLLEVNISPSLHSELPLDMHIKGPLVQAVLNTAMYQVPPRLTQEQEETILAEYNLPISGKLCMDKRLYITFLSPEETKKHNYYTSKNIETREEYLESILDNLTPDDIRCLIIAEDELARCSPLERVFPGQKSQHFLEFLDSPRYYNRLLDAWETRYGKNRAEGIQRLQKLCTEKRHLEVPATPTNKLSEELEISDENTQDILSINKNTVSQDMDQNSFQCPVSSIKDKENLNTREIVQTM